MILSTYRNLVAIAGLAAACVVAQPAFAQNPEMLERTCQNLHNMAEAEGWSDQSDFFVRIAGDYDDPGRQSNPDWRLETICDGRFIWAFALFGDVAPFAFEQTGEIGHYTDWTDNEWIVTLDADGEVESLDWVTQTNGTFTLLPVD